MSDLRPILAYLDPDDEVTSAAERIRSAAGDGRTLVLVLPEGSRLGTSRINFRLLAREAERRGVRLAVVSPEAAIRALVTAAGIAAYGSVGEVERGALPGKPHDDVPADPGAGLPAPASGSIAQVAGGLRSGAALRGSTGIEAARPLASTRPSMATRIPAPLPGSSAVRPSAERPGAERPIPTRRRGARLAAALGATALLLAFGGFAGTNLFARATVTIHVPSEPLPEVAVTVFADPTAVATDVAAGVIPAVRRTFPLVVEGSFPARGIRVDETVATGEVRWRNCDPGRAYLIPAGTVVRTAAGIRFAVDEPVLLPVALLVGSKPDLVCTFRTSLVAAVEPGLGGNVAAGAIVRIPTVYNDRLITVTNPRETSGGTRTETPFVRQADVDAALRSLAKKLDAALAAAAEDEARRAASDGSTSGLIVYPATATHDVGVPDPAPATLVGTEGARYRLALRATASVLGARPDDARPVAEARLAETVPSGSEPVPGSPTVTIGPGSVSGGAIRFELRATGRVVRRLDAAAVRASIGGLSVGEARDALRGYGTWTLETWPTWISSLPPADSGRLEVRLEYDTGTSP